MVIVYSSSDSYCEIAGISILSLMENNTNVETLDIYMIDNGISPENREKLVGMAEKYGRVITFVSPLDIEKLSDTRINIGRWNISTFYRLFLPTILPKGIDKVLYIDCDTLVLQDLSPLWDMDMEGKWLYGVDDCRGAAYRTNIGLRPEDKYINNGVIMIDLKAWKENKVEEKCLEFIRDHQGDITYVDQGVQNGVLGKLDKSGYMHPKYNCLTAFFAFKYDDLMRLRKPPVPMDRKQYEEAVANPAIVHFQSCFKMSLRPWVKGCKHPYTLEYQTYKAMSPWADSPMRKDDRTVPQKLLSAGTSIMPNGLMIRCISFAHTVVYPAARSLKGFLKR